MNDEIKTVLINYDFASSSQASREEISGTDKRNLWCAILRDNLSSRGCRLLFPGDIRGLSDVQINVEIHVNAGKPRTSAPYSIGLFMETPEIAPLNNATACRLYDRVISFNPGLHGLKNHVLAGLPCWDGNDLKLKVEKKRDYTVNTFSMIASNKNFKNPIKYKDLYKERARIIQYFETSKAEEFKLYGSAWNIRQELLAFPKLQKIARKLKIPGNLKSYGGICLRKNDVIRNSTFNICFENCVYPGYLSEKVFDAILGGSIPIYWGHHGIPQSLKTAVIDASQFQSPKDLIQNCRRLDIEERLEIIRNGINFLQSDGPKYSHQIYADQITRHIEKLLLAQ